MNKRDLLLEIGLEEIPARFILDAVELFGHKMEEWLEEKKLSFGDVQLYSTPRRLAILVKDVAESQLDEEEEVKGPAKKIVLDSEGGWSKAAMGFTKSQGVDVSQIYFKELKGVEYAYVKKFIKGKKAIELFSELEGLISSLHFPNNMRWGNMSVRFVRPIQWIVALFGHEVIPLTIAGVESSNVTKGHRFLGNDIEIDLPADYENSLLSQYVIASYTARREAIKDQIKMISEEENWVVPVDDDLLEEVTNLVEYPTAFSGTFKKEFLNLPEDVLITSMKEHQRYFPVKNNEGLLLSYFIGVRNGDHRHLETVVKGNEKVLHARLADAEFFYNEDKKIPIEQALNKLQSIVYHEKIGTLAEKVTRVRQNARTISEMLNVDEQDQLLIDRTAEISKFDLVTNMVNEFPELQGIMGEIYALQQGEDHNVAKAIHEHYLPKHADDHVPSSIIGSVVSIADKLDSIVSVFSIGLIPTGSQDPYALRRQAAGIIQILLENKMQIELDELIQKAIASMQLPNAEELYQSIENFFKLRLKYLLNAESIRHDIIEAIINSKLGNVTEMVQRARTLEVRKNDSTFKETVESLSRVINIATKAKNKTVIDPSLFENKYEEELYQRWKELTEKRATFLNSETHFEALAALQPTISAYFDHTMVMTDHESLKSNRLAQMKALAEEIESFACINEIIVK